MNEKTIEKHLCDGVKKLEGRAYKFVSPGNAGVPDRMVCLPGGAVIFVEIKAPGKKSTVQQEKKQTELRALGCEVHIVDTKEKVELLVEKWRGAYRL